MPLIDEARRYEYDFLYCYVCGGYRRFEWMNRKWWCEECKVRKTR